MFLMTPITTVVSILLCMHLYISSRCCHGGTAYCVIFLDDNGLTVVSIWLCSDDNDHYMASI